MGFGLAPCIGTHFVISLSLYSVHYLSIFNTYSLLCIPNFLGCVPWVKTFSDSFFDILYIGLRTVLQNYSYQFCPTEVVLFTLLIITFSFPHPVNVGHLLFSIFGTAFTPYFCLYPSYAGSLAFSSICYHFAFFSVES